MPGCARSASQQAGAARLDLLERHAAGLARERDQPEVAGGHHDDLGQRLGRCGARAVGPRRVPSPRRAGPSAPRRRRRAGACAVRACAGRRPASVSAAPSRPSASSSAGALGGDTSRPAAASRDELARASRRSAARNVAPWRLAVVGEHDELVRARRVRRRPRAIRAIARSTSRSTASVSGRSIAGVVRDLVVGEERRVDDRAGRRSMSAMTAATCRSSWIDGRARAHERVAQLALDARPHVAAALLERRAALGDDLADRSAAPCARRRTGWRSRRSSPARAGRGRAAVEHRAHRQQRVRRVAGEDVRAARAVGVQQPAAVGVAALDLGRVARVVRDDRACRAPSPTSGTRACRRCRRAAARPGRRRSATTSRSPSAAAGGRRRAASARASARCRRAARAAARRGRARRSRGTARRGRRCRPRAPARVRWRATTWRSHSAPSSSIASTAPAMGVERGQRRASRRSPVQKSSTWTPWSICAAASSTSAVEHERADAERQHRERQREADQQRPDQRVARARARPRARERGADSRRRGSRAGSR